MIRKYLVGKLNFVFLFFVLIVMSLIVLLWAQDQKYQAEMLRENSFRSGVLDQLGLVKLSLSSLDTRLDVFVGQFESYVSNQRNQPFPAPEQFRQMLAEVSFQTKVPIVVLCAVASAESDWFPGAVGDVNADGSRDFGLFQLNSKTIPLLKKAYWTSREKFDWRNPEHNMYLGACYLAENYSLLGSWSKSIMAFNAGPGSVQANPGRYTLYLDRVQARLVRFADEMISNRLN